MLELAITMLETLSGEFGPGACARAQRAPALALAGAGSMRFSPSVAAISATLAACARSFRAPALLGARALRGCLPARRVPRVPLLASCVACLQPGEWARVRFSLGV